MYGEVVAPSTEMKTQRKSHGFSPDLNSFSQILSLFLSLFSNLFLSTFPSFPTFFLSVLTFHTVYFSITTSKTEFVFHLAVSSSLTFPFSCFRRGPTLFLHVLKIWPGRFFFLFLPFLFLLSNLMIAGPYNGIH